MKQAVDKKAFGSRVAERRLLAGLSQPELARAVGMKQQGVDSIEKGLVERPRLLREIANALKTTEEWLLWGQGEPETEGDDDRNVIGVAGYISAGGTIETGDEQPDASGNLFEINVPFPVPSDAVAFVVKGESMWPRYDPDDVIICSRPSSDPQRLLGWEAAVSTPEGNRYLKRLMEGSRRGLYSLESHNAAPIRDVTIAWASEVLGLVRARRWERVTDAQRKRLIASSAKSARR